MNIDVEASEQSNKQILSAEILGSLILEELKGIRKDIKEEVKNLGYKLQQVLFSHLTSDSNLQPSSKVETSKINILDVNDLDDKEEEYPFFEGTNSVNSKEVIFQNNNFTRSHSDQVGTNSSSFSLDDSESHETQETSTYIKEELPTSGLDMKERSSSISEDEAALFQQTNDKAINSAISKVNKNLLTSIVNSDNSHIDFSNSSTSILDLPSHSQAQKSDITSRIEKVSDSNPFISDTRYENLIRNNLIPLYASLTAQQNLKNLIPLATSAAHQTSPSPKPAASQNISTSSFLNKRYKCQICGKIFAQKKYAEMHFRTHNGEKPFKCSVCNVGFLTNGNLKRHMIVHTGEKPYTCSYCGKSFSFSTNMKRHIQIHLRLQRKESGKTTNSHYVAIAKK